MLSDRQKKMLSVVIREYTETAVPVGSKNLVDKYGMDFSPATVRSELKKLEEKGFLHQPHVSAGRVPTDKGYRYFVESIMPDKELSRDDQKKLQAELLKLKAKNVRLDRTVAKLLGALSGSLAISGLIDKKEFFDFGMHELFEQPEFQKLDEVCKIAELLDYIDENVADIVKKIGPETKIFIGEENPIKEISSCSMVVSSYKTKSGEKGLLALIGPKRMEYAKNKSLIDYVKKLMGGAAIVVVSIWYFVQ